MILCESLNSHSPGKTVSLLDVQYLYFLKEISPTILKYMLITHIVYANNFSLYSQLYISTCEKHGQHSNQEAKVLIKED